MPKVLTSDQLKARIRRDANGNLAAYAREIGVTRQYLGDCLRAAEVPKALAARLGYTVERRYREME